MSQKTQQLEKALLRLQETLNESGQNTLAVDATIQRFELCFELFWKVLQEKLVDEGFELSSPKAALRQAFTLNWIEDKTVAGYAQGQKSDITYGPGRAGERDL
jgi:nucleotidyltransferase substrate binding protein (TIGR01987 family)